MNERIRELIFETDEWLESNAQSDRWEREIKFAQLIVRDCALTAGIMEYEGRAGIGAQLLDNFEVKPD
tara:strand:+ start:1666 stop:1869 length:204 start_codon:yes stop_codon:yes gene_type:complete